MLPRQGGHSVRGVNPRNLIRFTKAAPSALVRCEAAKLDQARLVRVKRQRVFLQSLAHRIPESSGIGLVLETNDDVVGVAQPRAVASVQPTGRRRSAGRHSRAVAMPPTLALFPFAYCHDPVDTSSGGLVVNWECELERWLSS